MQDRLNLMYAIVKRNIINRLEQETKITYANIGTFKKP